MSCTMIMLCECVLQSVSLSELYLDFLIEFIHLFDMIRRQYGLVYWFEPLEKYTISSVISFG